jgi:hypothetical protein
LGHEVKKYVLGEFWGFTLIYEEIFNGGIGNWTFLKFYSWFHVVPLRRGDS